MDLSYLNYMKLIVKTIGMDQIANIFNLELMLRLLKQILIIYMDIPLIIIYKKIKQCVKTFFNFKKLDK